MGVIASGRFTKGLISLVVIIVTGAVVLACSFYEETDQDTHKVFSQELMGPTRFQPFFYTLDSTYYAYDDKDSIYNEQLANIKEWSKYLNNAATPTDIADFIYHSEFSFFGNGKLGNDTLTKYLKDNTCYKALLAGNDQDAMTYIFYAKACEPYVIKRGTEGDWDYALPQADTMLMSILAARCEQNMKATKSQFLQMRYAYQLVRLANYTYKFSDCVNLYDTYLEPNKTKSIVRYWALSLKARALYKLNRWAESQYCYAMVFDRCNTRRHLAKQGFNWAAEYGDGLRYTAGHKTGGPNPIQYCKDQLEKIPVFALQANQEELYRNTNLLDSIYRIDPKSEMLEWLMMRAVSQLEHATFPGTSAWLNYSYNNDDWSNKRAEDNSIQKFIVAVAAENKTRQPQLWCFAGAYASYAVGDFASSKKLIADAKAKGVLPKVMAHEIEMLELLMKISEIKTPDAAFEANMAKSIGAFYGYMKEMNSADAQSLIWLQLAQLYHKQYDSYKEYMCLARSRQGYDPWRIKDEPTINLLIAFVSKQNKTPFEEMLASSYTLNILQDVKGTIQLCAHQWQAAINTYSISNTGRGALLADPFLIHRKDCHDCDYAHPLAAPYNRMTFVKRMMEFEKLANTKGPEQARSCYLYANGLYNMTGFGNSWMATNESLNYQFWGEDAHHQQQSFFSDCRPAKNYYEMAEKLAGKDKEFAAECSFMIAKCVMNENYASSEFGYASNPQFPEFSKKYSNTQYYKECGFFSNYLTISHMDTK